MIGDQLVRGLYSKDIVADVIGDEKTDRTLLELVNFIARKEQASLERNQVGVENTRVSAVKQTTPATSQTKFRYCRGETHGAETVQVRREKCPAYDNKCTKCQIKGHYEKACFKCSDCGKWGHKSKDSRWCATGGDDQTSDNEVGVILSAMTMRQKRRGGKKSSASKKELRQVTLAGQPRKGSTTSSHPTPINSSASRKYERPSEFCRSASIFSKSGTATPNFLAGYRRSNDELTNKLSTLGTQLLGDDFASGNGALSQEIMTNSSKRHNFERGWTTKVRNDHAGHEAHNTSPLLLTSFTPSRPVMSTGGGFFSSNNYSQFTPNPVPTAATTYTVTIITSPASVSAQKWERPINSGCLPHRVGGSIYWALVQLQCILLQCQAHHSTFSNMTGHVCQLQRDCTPLRYQVSQLLLLKVLPKLLLIQQRRKCYQFL